MRSWVEGADGSGFGIDSLPLGIYRDGGAPRPGVAIGPWIADLSALIRRRIVDEESLLDAETLNAYLARGPAAWSTVRGSLQRAFGSEAAGDVVSAVRQSLVWRTDVVMELPVTIPDYVDFYSSIEHATNVGRLFRPDGDPLPKNYLHLPIGYHGRAGTVVVSDTPIQRPRGQFKVIEADFPSFGPSRQLDIELEIGFVVGPPSQLGRPVPLAEARDHVYGFVLLNDWSARDIQAWEYQPLGPFLGKSFATSISPWIVSLEALEPARVGARVQEPPPLDYLRSGTDDAYNIELEVWLRSRLMAETGIAPMRITQVNFRNMYWSFAQQLAHATVNGASIRAGDLFGSGTISGSSADACGSLLELTFGGQRPLVLPTSERRSYLEDGDTIVMRGIAVGNGHRVGFGELTGTIYA